MSGKEIDLGFSHVARPWAYSLSGETAGYLIDHPDKRDPSKECCGSIQIQGVPIPPGFPAERAKWVLTGVPPLFTLTPSVLCTLCGDHGFIKNGKWEPA